MIKQFTLSFCKMHSGQQIFKTRVNVVAPGMVSDTQMYDATPQVTIESHLGVTPTKHFISAAQLAEIVVDISKPHWSQLNGATIDLNGAQYVR